MTVSSPARHGRGGEEKMWNNWTRIWRGHGEPVGGPPDETVASTSKSENDPGTLAAPAAAPNENDGGASPGAVAADSGNAAGPDPETLGAVERTLGMATPIS